MKFLKSLYSRVILCILIFGSAFILVALLTLGRENKGLLALLRGQYGSELNSLAEQPFTIKQKEGLTDEDVPALALLDREISEMQEQVSPSVVTILTGEVSGSHKLSEGQGSGVIVTKEGHIMTNYHVIASKSKITVELVDGTLKKAKLVGTDARKDLAMLKIEAEGVDPISFGDSDQVKVGHRVFVLGNPYRLGVAFSEGNIAATNRSISDMQNDLFQITAPLNKGQSGGALVNIKGELVGINSAIYSSNASFQGIAYSIPANDVLESMNIILKRQKSSDGYLGVELLRLTDYYKKKLKYNRSSGALIYNVSPMSPAARAGLKRFDIATHFNDTVIKHNYHLIEMIRRNPSKKVRLSLWRLGGSEELVVTLGDIDQADSASSLAFEEKSIGGFLVRKVGILPVEVTAEERALGNYGVKVLSVTQGSLVEKFIEPGDYIYSVNGARITTVEQFIKIMSHSVFKGRTRLHFLRTRTKESMVLQLPKLSMKK